MDSLEKKIKELHTKGLTKFENFLNEEEINSLMRINLKKKKKILRINLKIMLNGMTLIYGN